MPDQPPGPSDAQPTPAPGAVEQFGPLTLRRLVKDDGRALIFFSVTEPAHENAQ
jgi:hypothetical protein